MGRVLLMALLGLGAFVASQPCSPNICNGHGACEGSNGASAKACSCFNGWTGADCSLQTCPQGYAWNDAALGVDSAHNWAECSLRGACDRTTGVCSCDSGFEGQACERRTCPGNCYDHGRCLSMKYYASLKDPGEGTIHDYSAVWDADQMFGCVCDEGYSGPDCSQRECAVGDDPLTGTGITGDPQQYNEKQTVTCAATGGTFTLTFRGETTAAIAYTATATEVVASLEALATVSNTYNSAISVQYDTGGGITTACTSGGHSWTVEFLQDFGDLPLMVPTPTLLTHSGTVSLTVAETTPGTKESSPCSNRGLCDAASGQCTCDAKFGSSNGVGALGQRSDCGDIINDAVAVTACQGVTSCSGHGTCSGSPTYTCTCDSGWIGADCSQQVCAMGKSWYSHPTADNEAHLHLAECSDMGICNRSTGVCACMAGFEGSSCNRMECPGKDADGNGSVCSMHGQCMTMAQLAASATLNGDATAYTYGATPNDPLRWDHDMVQGCKCDEGFFGHDCSLRSCPYGDDPDTTGQLSEEQSITCTDADGVGEIYLSFRQATTTLLSPATTSAEIQAALEALPTIGSVTVACDGTGVLCHSTTSTCVVTFLTESGDLPNMQPASSGVDTAATVAETAKGSKENEECGRKGTCNYSTGLCECFPGYGGSNGQGEMGDLGECGYRMPYVNVGLHS
ncbi:unnamed protein product [Chrysoparadoxa australica]